MKRLITCFLVISASVVFGQKITFNIENDSIGSKFSLRTLSNKVLHDVELKEFNFDLPDTNLEEGYYLLKKGENEALLYIRPEDELTINFDAQQFHNSLVFTGGGADINTYLANRNKVFLDEDGEQRDFYKENFYEGNEQTYLRKIDGHYKELYGVLFSGTLEDEDFVNEEMKNLQYGYSLDLLKYEYAKEHYKINDSIRPSKSFLEPLSRVHFDNEQLFNKYYEYTKLSILKWRNDIENADNFGYKQDIISSIRTEAMKEGVLESLYKLMSRDTPELTKEYFDLIKANSISNEFIATAKNKYNRIRFVDAEKNISKFKFINDNGEGVRLSDYKDNYIFMNVWASWCKPCVKDFKEVEKLNDEYHDKNILFINVSVDKKENFEQWAAIAKEHKEAVQLLYQGSKVKFVNTYDISAIPTGVLLTAEGKVIDNTLKVKSKKTRKFLDSLFE